TPVDSAMPGVEVHAQLIEAALANSLLKAPGSMILFEILGSAIAALVILILSPIVSALVLLVTTVLMIAVFASTSWVLYGNYQILLDPTFPLIVTISVYVSLALIGYFQEQADRQRIRLAFAQYLSPSVVEQLARSPQKLVLGGERRNMTVL